MKNKFFTLLLFFALVPKESYGQIAWDIDGLSNLARMNCAELSTFLKKNGYQYVSTYENMVTFRRGTIAISKKCISSEGETNGISIDTNDGYIVESLQNSCKRNGYEYSGSHTDNYGDIQYKYKKGSNSLLIITEQKDANGIYFQNILFLLFE
jgi:hypothetical protein